MYTEDTHKSCKFRKNRARDPPLRGNYIGKIQFFSVFGAVNPHPWTDQGQIWQGGADGHTVHSSLPNLTLIGSTKIGPWVNEIPTELPAADPAGNKINLFFRTDTLNFALVCRWRCAHGSECSTTAVAHACCTCQLQRSTASSSTGSKCPSADLCDSCTYAVVSTCAC